MVSLTYKPQIKVDVQRVAKPRYNDVNIKDYPFGTLFGDHMFVVDYEDGQWKSPSVIPYGPIQISPALSSLHYGQTIFEGMKAYRDVNGDVHVFRPITHLERLNRSAGRLCMPEIPEDVFMAGLLEVLSVDKNWVPEDGALYIRPIYFATDAAVGVQPSHNYRLIIFTCPVTTYYAKPLRVWVASNYVRATEGGIGFVKTAGNYAGAMLAGKLGREHGCNVVLWLDAVKRKFIEEFSTMNAFFVINDFVVTPKLGRTILEGITRDSILRILRDNGYTVFERDISIDEIIQCCEAGMLKEAFGTGTAAVVAPVEAIVNEGQEVTLPPIDSFKTMNFVAKTLADIRARRIPDPYNWLVRVE